MFELYHNLPIKATCLFVFSLTFVSLISLSLIIIIYIDQVSNLFFHFFKHNVIMI